MPHTTFIHTSDLQLGMKRAYLPEEAQSRFDDARLAALTRLGELATEHGAEFIVVAGDVFEHNALEDRTFGRAKEALRALPVPCYLLPGNHDPLVAGSLFHRLEDVPGVTVLDSFQPVTVRPGVEILGAPLTARHVDYDPCQKALFGVGPTDAIRILVGHGQVESRGEDQTADLLDLAEMEARLADATVDYVALGDTHSTQSLGGTGRVWFSGAPETTNFHDHQPGSAGGEVDSGNALVVRVEKGGPADVEADVEKVPVGRWTFDALSFDVTDGQDVDALIETLRSYPVKERTVVKYAIRGTLGLEESRRLEEELSTLEPVFASLYERTRLMDLHLAPTEEELENLPLAGFAQAAMGELVGAAASGDATARDAVNLLFRLAKED